MDAATFVMPLAAAITPDNAHLLVPMHAERLAGALAHYLDSHPSEAAIQERDLRATYTASASYLRSVATFQQHWTKARAVHSLLSRFSPATRTLDLGCNAGFTGLALLLNGWQSVDFADFAGLGLGFVREFCAAQGYGSLVREMVADGREPDWGRYELVLAFDVIEHTPNQLAFIEWLRRLGDVAAVTWPTVNWQPPLYQQVDTWLDDEAMLWVLERRFEVLETWYADGRRYVLFQTGG